MKKSLPASLYTGTQELAANGDLAVSVHLGDNPEITLPFMPGDANSACAEIETVTPNFNGLTALLGGVAADEQYGTVVNGSVFLNGTFLQLAGIQVTSDNGRLSQQWVELSNGGRIPLTAPFPAGTTPQNSADRVVVGVLGAANRVDIEQSIVQTAIQYDGTQEDAGSNLTIEVGLGDDGPKSIPIGGEVGSVDGTFEVEEGVITLVGDFSRLSGIEATSQGGFLSFADELTEPFSADAAVLINESDGKSILLGVNMAADRVDLEGVTRTALRYSASDAVALTDLTIRLGIAGQGAVPIEYMDAAVPEPNSRAMLFIGIFVVALRKRASRRLSATETA